MRSEQEKELKCDKTFADAIIMRESPMRVTIQESKTKHLNPFPVDQDEPTVFITDVPKDHVIVCGCAGSLDEAMHESSYFLCKTAEDIKKIFSLRKSGKYGIVLWYTIPREMLDEWAAPAPAFNSAGLSFFSPVPPRETFSSPVKYTVKGKGEITLSLVEKKTTLPLFIDLATDLESSGGTSNPELVAERDALIEKLKTPAIIQPAPKIIYKMERLPLSVVFKSLYQLAESSEQGLKDKKSALAQTANVAGLYAPLRQYELEWELEKQASSGKIGYIGYLYLGITILANGDLDLAEYLERYGLSEQNVKNQLDKHKPKASNNITTNTSAFFQSNSGGFRRDEKDKLPGLAHLSEEEHAEHLSKIKSDLNKILGISDNLVTDVRAGMAVLHTSIVMSFNMAIHPDLYESLMEQKLLAGIKDVKLIKCSVYIKLEIPDNPEIYNQFMRNIETALSEVGEFKTQLKK